MTELKELMNSIIRDHRTIDVAESEFKRMVYEDDVLHQDYKDWCRREGFTERRGFIEYCNAYIDMEESRWDVLDNPDE